MPVTDPECLKFDCNGDGFIDMLDFACFQRCFSQMDVPADPGCE
jgi:hypothetical protein